MTTNPLADHADTLLTLRADKETYERILTEVNKAITVAESDLADAMIDADMPEFAYGQHKFKVDTATVIRPVPVPAEWGKAPNPHAQAVDQYIAEHEPSMVKPTVHHATRNKWMAESFLNDDGDVVGLPAELAEHVEAVTYPRIRVRKATS